MQLPFTTLDIFTSTRYAGNPLAIIRVPAHLRAHLSEDQKQAIAAEFNLSETVFLHDVREGEEWADYDIFTPRSRMSFAGHPTIGTAIYLSTLQQNAETSALFKNIQKIKTITGVVPFESSAPTTKGPREGQGQAQHSLGTAQVSIPHNVHIHSHRLPHLDLSANPHEENTVPLVSIVKGMTFNLVPMKDLAALGRVSQGLLPIDQVFDGKWLDKGSGWDVGYTGTFYYVDLGWEDIAFEDGDRDSGEGRRRRVLRTRSIGTREDPGTGSASCALCCYLALIQNEAGEGERRVEFHLTQGVEMGRRCDIYVSVLRTPDGRGIEEVKMSGEAVKVMEGVLGVGED